MLNSKLRKLEGMTDIKNPGLDYGIIEAKKKSDLSFAAYYTRIWFSYQ